MTESSNTLPSDAPANDLTTRLLTRGLAIAALVAIAMVHLSQIPDTYRQTPGLGLMFILLVIATSATAAALVHTDHRILWYAAALSTAGATGGYVLTRSMAVPFDRSDVGNWLEPTGLVALFLEVSLIALCAYRLRVVERASHASVADRHSLPLGLAQLLT